MKAEDRVGTVTIAVTDPRSEDAQWCLGQYFRELGESFETGYDPALDRGYDVDGFVPPQGVMLLVREGRRAMGCGVVRLLDEATGEVKRMWIDPAYRGRGLASELLAALEAWALEAGCARVVLDTNSSLTKAIAFYRHKGYTQIERYNEGSYCDLFFEKALGG